MYANIKLAMHKNNPLCNWHRLLRFFLKSQPRPFTSVEVIHLLGSFICWGHLSVRVIYLLFVFFLVFLFRRITSDGRNYCLHFAVVKGSDANVYAEMLVSNRYVCDYYYYYYYLHCSGYFCTVTLSALRRLSLVDWS